MKLVISPIWASELNRIVVRAHPELLSLAGLPATDTLRFAGDTIVIPFKNGATADPTGSKAKLVVSDPPLPDQRYANEHGYLAACELNIMDGVVPVITKAVYHVDSDILEVTFNKLPGVHTVGELVPFTLWSSVYAYELKLMPEPRQENNTYYFEVISMDGSNPPPGGVPLEGDSIRVKVGGRGIWQKDTAIVQENPNNTAVALKIKYPDFRYIVKVGPNPSADTVRIFVGLALADTTRGVSKTTTYMQSALDGSAIRAVIFDKMGSAAVVIESEAGKDGGAERRVLVWDGRNKKGRRVGVGTYRIAVIITGMDGVKKTEWSKVYITRGKGSGGR